jgi:iron complex outermembrane receptor protein
MDFRTPRENSSKTRLLQAPAVSVLVLMLASPVFAQNASAPPTSAPSVQDQATPQSVADIVVTARKREERLRDVPDAVTALSGTQLRAKNIVQLIDLPSITPNFQFSYGAVQPFTFIRGFGSGANASFEQSVGKFIDNVSYGRDQDGRIPIFDVDHIEVLKGPQVLTFGSSATVGALNETTKKPGRIFEADGSVSYEFNEDQVQFQGGVTAPLADWATLRVAGLYDDLAKGRLYNPLAGKHEPDTQNWAIRPTLVLTPAAGLEINLHGEYDHLRDFGNSVVAIDQPLKPGALLYPEVGDTGVRAVNYSRGPVSSPELGGLNAWLLQSDVNYKIFGGKLTSTTAYRHSDSDEQFGTDGPAHQEDYFNALWQHYNQFSQELRFARSFGPLDLTAGGYYQRDTLHIDLLQDFTLGGYGFTGPAATPFGRVASYSQRTTTYSGFVDSTYHLTDRLSLSAGVRYADIDKTAGQSIFAVSIPPGVNFDTTAGYLQSFQSSALTPLLHPVTGATAHNFPFGTLQLSEDHWQPQIILQYKLTPRDMIYAKYVEGDKVGGFDFLYAGTNPASAAFKPESAESYEIGMKGLTLDGRLEYSVDIFNTTFTSLQQSVFSNLVFVVSNVGRARARGLETELTFEPIKGMRLGFNGSYLDARFLSFPGAACDSVQNAAPGGCVTQNLSGAPTQYASKWTGDFSVDYERPIMDGRYYLGGGVSVQARSSYNAGAYNDPRMVQPGLATLDAHIDFHPNNSLWTFSFFARNLTDQRYLEYAVLAPGQSTAVLGTYARGQQLGLRLSIATR